MATCSSVKALLSLLSSPATENSRLCFRSLAAASKARARTGAAPRAAKAGAPKGDDAGGGPSISRTQLRESLLVLLPSS